MYTAALNDLAFRFGGFGRGGGFAFLLVFLALAGVLVWAIASSGADSSKG